MLTVFYPSTGFSLGNIKKTKSFLFPVTNTSPAIFLPIRPTNKEEIETGAIVISDNVELIGRPKHA